MSDREATPVRIPEKGFYYHYKHDPAGPINNYAYEFLGVGHHTEEDCRPIDAYLGIYRPLYEAFVYTHGKMFDARPLSMWVEDVEKDGKVFPRFAKITDAEVITELSRIRDEMYSD